MIDTKLGEETAVSTGRSLAGRVHADHRWKGKSNLKSLKYGYGSMLFFFFSSRYGRLHNIPLFNFAPFKQLLSLCHPIQMSAL